MRTSKLRDAFKRKGAAMIAVLFVMGTVLSTFSMTSIPVKAAEVCSYCGSSNLTLKGTEAGDTNCITLYYWSCDDCGNTTEESVTEHSWGEWQKLEDKDMQIRICTNCQEQEIQDIEASDNFNTDPISSNTTGSETSSTSNETITSTDTNTGETNTEETNTEETYTEETSTSNETQGTESVDIPVSTGEVTTELSASDKDEDDNSGNKITKKTEDIDETKAEADTKDAEEKTFGQEIIASVMEHKAPVLGTVGGVAAIVILTNVSGAVKTAKAAKVAGGVIKTAIEDEVSAAAKGIGEAAKDALEWEKPEIELEPKTILTCFSDAKESVKLQIALKKKKYVIARELSYDKRDSLDKVADAEEPDLILIEVPKAEDLPDIKRKMEEVKEKAESAEFGLLVDEEAYSLLKAELRELKKDGKIVAFINGKSKEEVQIAELLLPLYKPDPKSENSLGIIGSVADALGIPYVSNVLELFCTGRDIKETLEGGDLGAEDKLSVVASIAGFFGFEGLPRVNDFIEKAHLIHDVSTNKVEVEGEAETENQ